MQTAIAQAKKAEQDAITAEKDGEAAAARAKWLQEVDKAKAVTLAEQQKAVAETNALRDKNVAQLAMQAAQFTKQKDILLGEGEGAKKRAIMQANGALEEKLVVYKDVMLAFAQELGKQRWVPDVQMGGSEAGNGASEAAAFMQILSAKTARDLSLDMHMSGDAQTRSGTK